MMAFSSVPAIPAAPDVGVGGTAIKFEAVYEAHFPFVWRNVRRLGVPHASVEDVVQEIFVIVHRKLGDFEGRSSVKTWLFGILLRVVRDFRKSQRRKNPQGQEERLDPEALGDDPSQAPDQRAASAEGIRVLHALLDELDDEKREVLVLAELEQLTVPEIAESLGINLNTVYSRLRVARQEFEQAIQRRRAREEFGARARPSKERDRTQGEGQS
jgi:RNA polymerase sigma-70 factor (ECF subfamily)